MTRPHAIAAGRLLGGLLLAWPAVATGWERTLAFAREVAELGAPVLGARQ
ncbi:MAG: hypothetical protein KIT14_07095 [bacterium]|nr:hypothetical protein [bacterium]